MSGIDVQDKFYLELKYVGSVCARPCWTEHFAEKHLTHQTVLHQSARRIFCVCPSFLEHRYLGQGKRSKRISQGNEPMHLTEPNWWITGGQRHLVFILKTNASMLRALPAQDAKKCPRTRVDDGFVLVHADRLIFGASALRQSHVGRICWSQECDMCELLCDLCRKSQRCRSPDWELNCRWKSTSKITTISKGHNFLRSLLLCFCATQHFQCRGWNWVPFWPPTFLKILFVFSLGRYCYGVSPWTGFDRFRRSWLHHGTATCHWPAAESEMRKSDMFCVRCCTIHQFCSVHVRLINLP